MKRVLLYMAIFSLVQGCAGLPDQQLAKAALLRGDTTTAQQHYAALAKLGYADAQTELGDLQLSSRDPAQMEQVESLYRQAALSSVKAQSRLGRLLLRQGGASDASLKEAENLLSQAIEQGEYSAVVPLTLLYVSYPQLAPGVDPQQLVEGWRGQGITEAELAQILLYRSSGSYLAHLDEIEQKCRPLLRLQDICYVELATVNRLRDRPQAQTALLEKLRTAYANLWVAPNRIESVALALADPKIPAPADLSAAYALLQEVAPAYPGAWASLAKLLFDYPVLGSSEELLGYLQRGREAGDSRAELLTGRLYYDGRLLPQNPQLAEQHLLRAASGQPAAHFYLGQIYRRGYLGQVYPQKAVDHLLLAARAGHSRADFALAQLFSESRGVKVNRVNAYVFAQMARNQAVPEADALLVSLEPALLPAERQAAGQLLQEEQQTRQINPARFATFKSLEIGMDVL
ncbi:MAG: alginate biosynthesis protein AlgK [Pseudomonas sp.]|uniref:alginate biosynthesis protein AlgK n=1 Tax=Pseudomonas sp. TaxID=306 RepID=UPI00299F01B7|nr:alginate biosynthesis protein AlgK [Pseudomonas sp.]MDX1722493.1 alginate biosynthesis protein AlgK [Pseudomonas sp.]